MPRCSACGGESDDGQHYRCVSAARPARPAPGPRKCRARLHVNGLEVARCSLPEGHKVAHYSALVLLLWAAASPEEGARIMSAYWNAANAPEGRA